MLVSWYGFDGALVGKKAKLTHNTTLVVGCCEPFIKKKKLFCSISILFIYSRKILVTIFFFLLHSFRSFNIFGFIVCFCFRLMCF